MTDDTPKDDWLDRKLVYLSLAHKARRWLRTRDYDWDTIEVIKTLERLMREYGEGVDGGEERFYATMERAVRFHYQLKDGKIPPEIPQDERWKLKACLGVGLGYDEVLPDTLEEYLGDAETIREVLKRPYSEDGGDEDSER